jgi:hypothetical protein
MAETYLGPDGKRYPVNIERTQEGLQPVLGGAQPQNMKNKLDWLLAKPMPPRKRQKPCDIGLFDAESCRQLELF